MGDVRVLKMRENDRVNPSNDKLSVCVSWLFGSPDTIHSLGGIITFSNHRPIDIRIYIDHSHALADSIIFDDSEAERGKVSFIIVTNLNFKSARSVLHAEEGELKVYLGIEGGSWPRAETILHRWKGQARELLPMFA